jgi:hypothetical protein
VEGAAAVPGGEGRRTRSRHRAAREGSRRRTIAAAVSGHGGLAACPIGGPTFLRLD